MGRVSWRLSVTMAAVAALGGCAGEQPAGKLVDTTPAAFVRGARCVNCHAAETALWRGSHHDLAMQVATEATVRADFDGTRFQG